MVLLIVGGGGDRSSPYLASETYSRCAEEVLSESGLQNSWEKES